MRYVQLRLSQTESNMFDITLTGLFYGRYDRVVHELVLRVTLVLQRLKDF